ncbi:DNA-binding transcriptional LysR family regulator [Streptosporangium album]|uniref:DNA-binding transcriptional LysR family regulator n=1 Tax=Streptosporangium album TaxID=47479 RepID=A0A7W7WBG1_9ACTN|nr:LysR family transcriptional regulator [Streptosporangium album]MBB4940966.1 DNA-binding transcriptional LysR family regulator [Streptosporangium album]
MQLELRHLRVICAIADAGSLSRAATAVGVSQPALTAQLQRVEGALGGQVFWRGRLGVTPTPFGQFVLTRARSILLTVDELVTGVSAYDGQSNLVRIGGYVTPVLSGLLTRLFEVPGVSITVHTEYSPRLLLDLLASRRLDAVTLVDYPGNELPTLPSVGMRLVATEPVFVLMSSRHRLAAEEEVNLADLADDDWVISPPDGVGWPECVYSACQEAGFTPRVPHSMSEQAVIRQLVAGGHAVSPCQATVQDGPGIVVRPLAGNPLWLRHLVAWRRDGPLAQRAQELAEFAMEAHREAIAERPHYVAWTVRNGTAATLG